MRQRLPNGGPDSPIATRTGTMKTGTSATAATPVTTSYASAWQSHHARQSTRDTGVPPLSQKTIRQRLKWLMVPKKPVGDSPSAMASLKAIVYASWLNVLLVFIPISVCEMPSSRRLSELLRRCRLGRSAVREHGIG